MNKTAARAARSVVAALAPVAIVVAAGTGIARASSVHVPSEYAYRIRMAMDATYPPDEFMQNGKIVGFDADLGRALGKVMGVKVTMVDATFDTIIPGIVDGKFDVGNSSFTDTKAREGQVDFVDYFRAGEGFYEQANSTKTFNGLKSLCGHSVSVETGTTEQCDAETQAKSCHVTVLSYEDQNEANLAVSDGRADLGFADSQVAAYIVHLSNGQFKLTGTPFETAPTGSWSPRTAAWPPRCSPPSRPSWPTVSTRRSWTSGEYSRAPSRTPRSTVLSANRLRVAVPLEVVANGRTCDPRSAPTEMPVVPIRHPGRWVAAAVVVLLAVMLVHSLFFSHVGQRATRNASSGTSSTSIS